MVDATVDASHSGCFLKETAGACAVKAFPNPEKVFGGFEIFSLLLHIFAYARIHFQKKKLMVGPQTRHIFLKILSLADIEKTSIATFALYFLNVVLISISILFIFPEIKFKIVFLFICIYK